MRVVTVVGARPQFIKVSPLARALDERGVDHLIVHTGQHYDAAMSDDLFEEFALPQPWRHLGVGSAPAPIQVGEMLVRLSPVLEEAQPDVVIVPGDTNSTLAGALAAAQLGLPVAHVEAGLRSFRRDMPEERNRVLTDHLAHVLYAPSQRSVDWLAAEGIQHGVVLAGDVMRDVLAWQLGREDSGGLDRLGLEPGGYVLATVHRPRNADDRERREAIVRGLGAIAETWPVVLPVHPRTRRNLAELPRGVRAIDPLGHRDVVELAASARAVVTDSGGLQKEAYWLGVPCVTLRAETEWVETVEQGWNTLVDADERAIVAAVTRPASGTDDRDAYGTLGAADRIVDDLMARFSAPPRGRLRSPDPDPPPRGKGAWAG
ncbi:MAG TPA: UDP-N-acetylglucosamine 2-epimerase (non-hydrolyzing) [Nitriliruptorales bacterium]